MAEICTCIYSYLVQQFICVVASAHVLVESFLEGQFICYAKSEAMCSCLLAIIYCYPVVCSQTVVQANHFLSIV